MIVGAGRVVTARLGCCNGSQPYTTMSFHHIRRLSIVIDVLEAMYAFPQSSALVVWSSTAGAAMVTADSVKDDGIWGPTADRGWRRRHKRRAGHKLEYERDLSWYMVRSARVGRGIAWVLLENMCLDTRADCLWSVV